LAFSEIPHQSRLFIEYQQAPESLRKYYPNAVFSYDSISAFVPQVLSNYETDRNELCNALIDINEEIGAASGTFANIELLRAPGTVAVVTGQQSGLFTGPLYTIYKALTAIKMAACLNAAGTRAVPVFWVATEDHDFDEVSRTYFVGANNELVESHYEPVGRAEGLPVGSVRIDGPIGALIETIFAEIANTEVSGEVRVYLKDVWAEGRLFGTAFAKDLAGILSKYGLVFVDPMNERLKTLAAPIYSKAIKNTTGIVASIRQRSKDLETEGYHAQVLVEDDYFPLFWHDDEGRRLALRKTGENTYRSKAEQREFTLEELAAVAETEPRRFSPGVMLRPVVQDYLLPTLCYFGGGAEIAYFAQNSEAYRILGRPVTPILHRQSFTIVEAKHQRTLEKFDLDLTDLFSGMDTVLENIGKNQLSCETARTFAEAEEVTNLQLNRLDQNLLQIDSTLSANLAKRRRKILYHIAALRKKACLTQVRRDETIGRQIRSVFTALLPNGELQERVLNVHSFLNKYGPYFIDWIYEAIDLNNKGHRIIRL